MTVAAEPHLGGSPTKQHSGRGPHGVAGATRALQWAAVVLLLLGASTTALLLAGLAGQQLSTHQLRISVAKAALNAGWRRNFHRLAGVHWDVKHASGLLPNETRAQLEPLWNFTFTLPQPQLQRSLVYLGPNARLRRVLLGLQQGQATRVGVIGGSISHGARASRIGENDWFSIVRTYLSQAFPLTKIFFRNGCLPATPSALMEMCLERSIDADVDLLFIEYVANDGPNRMDETKAKVYERLLRKALQQERQPAVVLVQLLPKGAALGPRHKEKTQFYHTIEEAYGSLAQYYDTPWLSWRNAVWRMAELHRYGYNWTDFMWDQDWMHPIDLGHKTIADMVVYLLQQSALQVFMSPYGVADLDLLVEPLPRPMFPGNYDGRNRLCVYGEAFKGVADGSGSPGWEFVDEGGGPSKRKWGFVSSKPGSMLRIKLDTRRQGGAAGSSAPPWQAGGRMGVMLAYLRSYENMGMAQASCLSGCSCKPALIDGHHTLRQSTIFLARLLPTEAAECVIGVQVLKNTTSGKHKFKVSGIMVNEYTGADVTTRVHEEQWLHGMLTLNDPNAPTAKVRASQPQPKQPQQPKPQQQPQQQQPQQQPSPPPQQAGQIKA